MKPMADSSDPALCELLGLAPGEEPAVRLRELARRMEALASGSVPPVSVEDRGRLPEALFNLELKLGIFLEDMERVGRGSLEASARPFGRFSEVFNELRESLQLATDRLSEQCLVAERQASRDGLTGLLNRASLMERFQEELLRSNRYQKSLSIIMMDLDNFKSVNDTWGHQAGDEVLKGLAVTILRQVRITDVAGRYGGEEFLILATDTEPANALRLAERIRRDMESLSFVFGGEPLRVTLSQGVAGKTFTQDLELPELVRRADLALYRAKKSGKNRVEFWTPDLDTI